MEKQEKDLNSIDVVERENIMKMNICSAFHDYIVFLQDLLNDEKDDFKRWFLERKIREVKDQQEYYKVDNIKDNNKQLVKKNNKRCV